MLPAFLYAAATALEWNTLADTFAPRRLLPNVQTQRILLTPSAFLKHPVRLTLVPHTHRYRALLRAHTETSPTHQSVLSRSLPMASRALLLCVSVVLAVAVVSEARDFLVGGASDGWKVPAQPNALNNWAKANHFHVGDKLVFKFNGAADSVLEVTQDDYNRCGTASPISTYKTGDATVPLPRSGAHYFVSGTPGSCEKGERLVVVVISEKHGRRHGVAPVPAPAPAQSPLVAAPVGGPAAAPAPATGAAGRTAAAAGSGVLLLGTFLAALVVGF